MIKISKADRDNGYRALGLEGERSGTLMTTRTLLFLVIVIITLASISAHAQFKRADSPPPAAPAAAVSAAPSTPAAAPAPTTSPAAPVAASTAKSKVRKATKKGAPATAATVAAGTVAAAPMNEKERMARLHTELDALLATNNTGK